MLNCMNGVVTLEFTTAISTTDLVPVVLVLGGGTAWGLCRLESLHTMLHTTEA